MGVPLLDLRAQHATLREESEAALRRVVEAQQFILGDEVAAFEREMASLVGVPHALGVASGTDALLLALRGAGVQRGEEVVVPSFTFFATAGAVVNAGGTPVFADIEPEAFNLDPAALESAVSDRTRAIVVVHLFGQCADLEPILSLAARRGIAVIEDAAQAIGATYHSRQAGSMGLAGCLSFFPSKNLGGYGDGGMITTTDAALDARLRRLRVHGQTGTYLHQEVGFNSRLDALQAAVLRYRLGTLDAMIERRRSNAERYRALLADVPIRLPRQKPYEFHTFVNFVSQCDRRDELQKHLAGKGVQTVVHYNTPIHLQPAAESLGCRRGQFPVTERLCETILALPANQTLAEDDIAFVASEIRAVLGPSAS